MSDVAISVEGLGKRYRLRHETAGAPRYRTLREDLLSAPGTLLRRLRGRSANSEAFWALKDVSFEVRRGEVLGIIGRNGAGKSTLLKILSRTVKPTEGIADVYGRIGSLLEVGTGFHPELTGRENVFLSGALLGMQRHEIRKRSDEIVEFAELERFIDTPCKHYSSGMYLRLGFAVAAHLDAEILLVDEVLAVGDIQFQRRCLGKMGDVSKSGKTVMLVSHNLDAVSRLCIRSLWVHEGRVHDDGPTGDIINSYLQNSTNDSLNPFMMHATFERGSKTIWFSSILVTGKGASAIKTGDRASFVFTINADEDNAAKPVCFTIGIRTTDGFPIALMADMDSGFRLAGVAGPAKVITVTFESFPLYPGEYFVRLWAGSHDAIETYDDRQDCLLIRVISAGESVCRKLLRQQGVVFLRPNWAISG